jgi:hypothetical protein
MLNWNYNASEYNARSGLLEEGKYRVRIMNAKQTVAKNGTEGLEISLEVNGHANKLRHFIWYNRENPARTNQLLGEFFDSFEIHPERQNDCDAWIGHKGAVYVVHDSYKGHRIAKVSHCIGFADQKELPEWQVDYFGPNSQEQLPQVASPYPVVTPVREFGNFNF